MVFTFDFCVISGPYGLTGRDLAVSCLIRRNSSMAKDFTAMLVFFYDYTFCADYRRTTAGKDPLQLWLQYCMFHDFTVGKRKLKLMNMYPNKMLGLSVLNKLTLTGNQYLMIFSRLIHLL
jgi:hypothetical protein